MSKRRSLTVTEYAAAMGVHPRTAQQWARAGRIRATRTAGGHWRIPTSQVAQPRYLTVEEFAAAVGVCARTPLRWIAAGKLQATRRGEHTRWLIPIREVKRLQEQTVDNSSEA